METQKMFPGKSFISYILDTLEYKTEMTGQMKRRYLMRAAMAGAIVGLLYIGNYALMAGFESIGQTADNPTGLLQVGKVLGSILFGFALVYIYYSRSELLTSNMMITTVGYYYKRIKPGPIFRILSLCYLGNFLGGLIIAVLAWASTIISDPTMEVMQHSIDAKLGFITEGASGWLDLFVRAILCNFCINLAMLMVYNGSIHDDVMKALAMIVGVFIFAFLGFEHSVANTAFFTMVGLQEGIEIVPAVLNVILALLGNFVGGGIMIGLYYAYLNDEARYTRQHPELGNPQAKS